MFFFQKKNVSTKLARSATTDVRVSSSPPRGGSSSTSWERGYVGNNVMGRIWRFLFVLQAYDLFKSMEARSFDEAREGETLMEYISREVERALEQV